MVTRGYCIEIVLEFYFRDIFVYKIGIRIISKIYPGLWIIQTPPPLTGPLLSLISHFLSRISHFFSHFLSRISHFFCHLAFPMSHLAFLISISHFYLASHMSLMASVKAPWQMTFKYRGTEYFQTWFHRFFCWLS